jgi:hypothetical protein
MTTVEVQAEGTSMPVLVILDTPVIEVPTPTPPPIFITSPPTPLIEVKVSGDPGGPGAPGLIWRGEWDPQTDYAQDDAVTYTSTIPPATSPSTSSWVAVLPSSNLPPPDHPSQWDLLASSGAPGSPGPPGPEGLNALGPWSPVTPYVPDDLVTSKGSSYLAVAPSLNVDPAADATTNPIASFIANTPVALGSPMAIATGFTVDRGSNVIALNIQPSWQAPVPAGVTVGIATDINVPGHPNGIQWLGKGTPTPDGRALMDTPFTLFPGPRYWLVILGAAGVMVEQGAELTTSHLAWSGEFYYGSTEPSTAFGTYASPVIMYGTTTEDPWQLFVAGTPGPEGEPGPPGPPGASGSAFEYTYNATTTAPPSSGQVRLDSTDTTAATFCFLHELTVTGEDVQVPLELAKVGDIVILQDKDESHKRVRYEVTSATWRDPSHMELGITHVLTGDLGPPPAGQRALVYLLRQFEGLTPEEADDRYVEALNGVAGLWKGTQAEYNAIPAPDPNTVYVVLP